MIISILITSILTLIAVAIGLFLIYKSRLKILSTSSKNNEKVCSDIEDLKNELFIKTQEQTNANSAKVDNSKNEIQQTVERYSNFLQEELTTKIKESDLHSSNAITDAKNALLELITTKINDLKTEVNLKLQNYSSEMNIKVENSSHLQEKRQQELIQEIQTKFKNIIDEIKNPLTID